MAEHSQGKTDIREHEKTFGGFIRFSTWVAAIVILVLVFLALVNA